MRDTSNAKALDAPLAAAIAIGAVTAALLIGRRASPAPENPGMRRWYRHLNKPAFTPPNWAFPVAWTGIQAAQAYAGYRLLRAAPSDGKRTAVALWTTGQLGIAAWNPIFFGLRAPGLATAASVAIGANAAASLAASHRVDRTASYLTVPLIAWVAFATLLSGDIWRTNKAAASDRADISGSNL